MIFGFLEQSIGNNQKLLIKTSTVKTKPYPDIVSWWKIVSQAFKLTSYQLREKAKELDYITQKPNETCSDYLLRFKCKAKEVIDAGHTMSEEEQGNILFQGFLSTVRYQIYQFMTSL